MNNLRNPGKSAERFSLLNLLLLVSLLGILAYFDRESPQDRLYRENIQTSEKYRASARKWLGDASVIPY